MFKKILIPLDGSDPSWQAFEYALEIGRKFNSNLVVVHVIQPFYDASFLAIPLDSSVFTEQLQELKQEAEMILNRAVEKAGNYPATIEKIIDNGHPSERILSMSKEKKCDAIVIGSRGLSGIAEFVLGSVSSNIAHYAKIPVLIIKCDKDTKAKKQG